MFWSHFVLQYPSVLDFLRDVRKMFRNCYDFHVRESQYYIHAQELEEILDKQLGIWLPELAYDQTIVDRERPKAFKAAGGASKKKR